MGTEGWSLRISLYPTHVDTLIRNMSVKLYHSDSSYMYYFLLSINWCMNGHDFDLQSNSNSFMLICLHAGVHCTSGS